MKLRLSFYIERLRHFQVRQNSCLPMRFSALPYCSPVAFDGLLVVYLTTERIMDLSACEKFTHTTLSDPSHPLDNDFSKCHFHTISRSPFLPTPACPSELKFSQSSPNSHKSRTYHDWLSTQTREFQMFIHNHSHFQLRKLISWRRQPFFTEIRTFLL